MSTGEQYRRNLFLCRLYLGSCCRFLPSVEMTGLAGEINEGKIKSPVNDAHEALWYKCEY